MKSLRLALILFPLTALGDQCAWIQESVGKKALERLKPGTIVLQYCEPCGDTEPKATTLEAAELKKVEGQDFFEVIVNTVAEDLAYLYVPEKGTTYRNLGKIVECGANGVSLQVTYPANPQDRPSLWRAQYASKQGGATLNVNQENRGPSLQIRFHYIADTSGDRLAELQGPAELENKKARFQTPFRGCALSLTQKEKGLSVLAEGSCGAMGTALAGEYAEVVARK